VFSPSFIVDRQLRNPLSSTSPFYFGFRKYPAQAPDKRRGGFGGSLRKSPNCACASWACSILFEQGRPGHHPLGPQARERGGFLIENAVALALTLTPQELQTLDTVYPPPRR
jgi:hypothetical protein